jgi:hypothetical protein
MGLTMGIARGGAVKNGVPLIAVILGKVRTEILAAAASREIFAAAASCT